MSEKKDNQNLNEEDKLDSAEINSQETESVSGEHDADAVGDDQAGEEAIQLEPSDSEAGIELSADELLEDVRRSLIVETTVEEEEKKSKKWWQQIGKSSKKKKVEPQLSGSEDDAVELPKAEAETETEEQDAKQDEYIEQLDELIDILEDKTQEAVDEGVSVAQPEETIPAEEQKIQEIVDFDELKKRVFAGTTPKEEEPSLSEVRSVALDGGEEVFIEVETKPEDTRQNRIKAIENVFKPYSRYLTFIFIFVSIVMVLLVSASIYRLYLNSLPPPTVEAPIDFPYPVGIALPGGLEFKLGKGRLQEDGRWEPQGPEWLVGTEVCRWIAIPYSRQMEAVILTLSREDTIKLTMSNNDVLEYTVYSREQLNIEGMQKLDQNSPCVLLVLAQSGTDERWVVQAIP